jgi:hypothetical protein
MAETNEKPTMALTIELEQAMFAALQEAATERNTQPEELVARWVRERLAHEAERRLGRARPQRPDRE